MPNQIPDEVILGLCEVEAYLRELLILAGRFAGDFPFRVPDGDDTRDDEEKWPRWAPGSCDPTEGEVPEWITTRRLLEETVRPAWETACSLLDKVLTLIGQDPDEFRRKQPEVLRPRPRKGVVGGV